MTKLYISLLTSMLFLCFGIGVTYAAYSSLATVSSNKFTVTGSSLGLLKDLTKGVGSSNIVTKLEGRDYSQVTSGWSHDYLVKVHNGNSSPINLGSYNYYVTTNDVDDLRYYLNVEIFDWDDSNDNGLLDEAELGKSYDKKSFVKWKTQGYSLGELKESTTRGFVLRFSVDSIADSKLGATGMFDFEFVDIPRGE
ncbi:MAG: hypothetical protein R3B92_03810 [Patescibacteria group bacterium]|uniref:EF-hand domain-containing protein n=1 Tax=candidate division WWE3 bacterium TaxID=2053526 RepID=A0A955ECS9_UNCKA|nr:hypothetical protein [candidate division WWE3 bacterium]